MALKKLWRLAAASLLSITSVAHADSCAGRCDCPDVKPVGACKSPFVPATNPCSLGVINPNARPYADCARSFVTLEGLLWSAQLDGLEFAIQNSEAPSLPAAQISANNSSPFYNATVLEPKSKWDYGFRVGLGRVLAHDGWDCYADWTHLRTSASKHVEIDIQLIPNRLYALYTAIVPGSENAQGISDLFSTPLGVNPTADNIHARWKLNYDIVDLELGREFYTSKYLTLRPRIVLRGATIHQKYDIDYIGGAFTVIGIPVVDEVDFKNNFWGIGVRGGLNTLWYWTKGCGGEWSFYGNLALSLIYGHFNIAQNENVQNVAGLMSIPSAGDETTLDDTTIDNLNVMSTEDSFRASRAMTDLALGLRYDCDCSDSSYKLALWIGWEQHIVFGMNQWVYYNSTISGTGHTAPASPDTYTRYTPQEGDLTTQGWTLGLEVDF